MVQMRRCSCVALYHKIIKKSICKLTSQFWAKYVDGWDLGILVNVGTYPGTLVQKNALKGLTAHPKQKCTACNRRVSAFLRRVAPLAT